MTARQNAWRLAMQSLVLPALGIATEEKPLSKRLTGSPDFYRNSNGLDMVDSYRQHESNFINSFNQ